MKKQKNSCDGIYANSLDVRFTKACDNHCPFCIERHGIGERGTDVEKLIKSTLKSQKKDILILGGEPFLKINELYQYVLGIRPYVEHIYITTSLPQTISKNYQTFRNIMQNIDGLNVSLQHYDDDFNNMLLSSKNPHKRIQLLEKICKNPEITRKIRVSVNLVKNYIDNEEALHNFLKKMANINVQHVKINELQHEENLYISFESIFKNVLEKNKISLKSPYSHGCQQDIILNEYPLKITVKRACFCVNNNLHATFSDFFKALGKKYKRISSNQLVLYEDGTLSHGWKQESSEIE